MGTNQSIGFFDRKFRNQPKKLALLLIQFEEMAVPYQQGDVLDFSCGMGSLSFATGK